MEDDGLEIEAIFKTAFDPAHSELSRAGEGDIVLLPEPTLSNEKIARLHPLIHDLYKAARSRMHRPELEHSAPYPSDGTRDVQRDINLHDSDLRDDRDENQERSARDQEDGWFYED